jgi:hypothetical protein
VSEDIQGVELVSSPAGHIEFGIPGVQGGFVRIALLDDADAMRNEIVRGLKVATYTREKWLGTFPEVEADHTPPEHKRDDPPQRQAPASGAVAFCEEHGMAPMQPSAPKFNPEGDKFWHPLNPPARRDGKDVKSHTLYWRQTVNAAGESNDGKLIPQGRA